MELELLDLFHGLTYSLVFFVLKENLSIVQALGPLNSESVPDLLTIASNAVFYTSSAIIQVSFWVGELQIMRNVDKLFWYFCYLRDV